MPAKSQKASTLLLLTALNLFIYFNVYSQEPSRTISGEVLDVTGSQPVGYATVSVTDSLSNIVFAAAADADGNFTISGLAEGSYTVTVSAVGYISYVHEISIAYDHLPSKLTVLLEEGIDVEKVEVVAQKPLIKVDAEKITYDVEADPLAATSMLEDIIKKVPQLTIDSEGNVLLNGHQNYKVLVDGKTSSMMSNNFREIIKSMPASSIKRIEVINNPSTRYESEGIGGLINIVTNRDRFDGYRGSAGLSYNSDQDIIGHGYLSAQLGKFTVSANYSGGKYVHRKRSEVSSQTNYLLDQARYTESRNSSNGDYTFHNFSLEASYEIDSLNLLTLSFWIYPDQRKYNSLYNYTVSDLNHSVREQLTQETKLVGKDKSFGAGIDYEKTFLKEGRSLVISYSLEMSPDEQNMHYNISSPTFPDPTLVHVRNKERSGEHTFQTDYYEPLADRHFIETGIKYIMRLNSGNNDKYLFDNGIWTHPADMQDADIDFDQHILGFYGGYLYKLEKIVAKVGFRLETTFNTGNVKNAANTMKFTNNQFNLIPYASISYNISETQSLNIAYTQRLQRPGISYLNPYVNDSDPSNISYGNPSLKATLSHSLSANYYFFKTSWSVIAGWSSTFSGNGITTVSRLNSTLARRETTYDNIAENQQHSIYTNLSYRLKDILSITTGINGYYSYFKATDLNLKNDAFGYYLYGYIQGKTWKNAGYSVNFYYYPSGISLQSDYKNKTVWHGVSLWQKLFKEKLQITLNATNPFKHKFSVVQNFYGNDYRSTSHTTGVSRYFGIQVGYSFGRNDIEVRKSKRSAANDDKLDTSTNTK